MVIFLLLLLSSEAGGVTFNEAQVIERALKESPRLKAREYQLEETQAYVEVARRWNNPQLRISGLRYDQLVDPAFDHRSYGNHPFEKAAIGLRWSPPELGQRDSLIANARVEEAVAKAEREQSRRDTIATVRELFLEVVNLERQRTLAKSLVDQQTKWRDLVQNRMKNQAATRFDQSLVDVEHVHATASLNEIEIRYQHAYEVLLVHMGLPANEKVKFIREAHDRCKSVTDLKILLRQAELGHPIAEVAIAEMNAADAAYRHSQLSLIPWPDFLQLSYVMAGDSSPSYLRLQLGLSLPFFDWKTADRRASLARGKRWLEKSRAENHELLTLIRQVAAEQQVQAALVERYQASAEVIKDGLSYVSRSLESGESTNMVQMLQLQARLLSAQKAALKAEWECQRGQIELDRLTGNWR